jgi:hypothetical protein
MEVSHTLASLPLPMRTCNLCYCFALLFLHPLAAQEPLIASSASASSSGAFRFRAANSGHDVSLRDGAKFPLPPGGGELGLQPTTVTPYDKYFDSVRRVIADLDTKPPSMANVGHLMKVGYSFQYLTRNPYRPDMPKLTEAQGAGDCKSKSLWLYDSLGDSGALFTIGKAEKNSRTSHAWVYWRYEKQWYILDCTDSNAPLLVDSVSPDRYVPYYSFGKHGAYRHTATATQPPPPAPAVGAPERRRSR